MLSLTNCTERCLLERYITLKVFCPLNFLFYEKTCYEETYWYFFLHWRKFEKCHNYFWCTSAKNISMHYAFATFKNIYYRYISSRFLKVSFTALTVFATAFCASVYPLETLEYNSLMGLTVWLTFDKIRSAKVLCNFSCKHQTTCTCTLRFVLYNIVKKTFSGHAWGGSHSGNKHALFW